jgi:hypothetical protein
LNRSFRRVFSGIQASVSERFTDSEVTQYTSISGFIFLRFFTPAILGPGLFHLKIGVQDEKSKRRFTLVAKVLQNLSNVALFGKKESFMEPMNSFISSRMDDMKSFIDEICKPFQDLSSLHRDFTTLSNDNPTLSNDVPTLSNASLDKTNDALVLSASMPSIIPMLPTAKMLPTASIASMVPTSKMAPTSSMTSVGPNSLSLPIEEVAKDTSDLIRYVALSMDKLMSYQPSHELIRDRLPLAIADIEKKIRKYDKDFTGFSS